MFIATVTYAFGAASDHHLLAGYRCQKNYDYGYCRVFRVGQITSGRLWCEKELLFDEAVTSMLNEMSDPWGAIEQETCCTLKQSEGKQWSRKGESTSQRQASSKSGVWSHFTGLNTCESTEPPGCRNSWLSVV